MTVTVPTTSRNICLARIPVGRPTHDDFTMTTVDVLPPKDGEITVRNLYMSVDPYMRGRMTGVKSYADPYVVGETMTGGAVGEVIASAHPDYKTGDKVVSLHGWREAYTAPVVENSIIGFRKVQDGPIALQSYLGLAGMPGLTAYAGLYDVADYKPGETVLVSGAAGAVGSVVCQLAKADGAQVVALAGTDAKCKWLESRGVDKAINYKTAAKTHGSLTKAIQLAAPQGIDVYYENVGGDMLEAALNVMNPFGRIAVCGMISDYNTTEPLTGPSNFIMTLVKSLKIQGFIVYNHHDSMPDYMAKLTPMIEAGTIVPSETVVSGIENSVEAFLRLFTGDKIGKMLVRL